MLNHNQLRELIIKPALYDLVLDSPNAEELLIFTCAVESLGGTYIKQINGPALGIYQMEPRTYIDIWQNYIENKPSLHLMLISNFACTFIPDEYRLIYDLRFSTALARIHYRRVKEQLPDHNNIDAIWDYYKTYYNTPKGASKKEDSINKYKAFIKA